MQYEKWIDVNYKKLESFYAEEDYGLTAKEWIAEDIKELREGELTVASISDVFKDLSRWGLHDTLFYLLHKKEEKEALKEFQKSSAYGYLCVTAIDQTWGCTAFHGSKKQFELMDKVNRMMAQCLIAGWDKEANTLADIMIESIRYGDTEEGNKIISTGFFATPAAWFMLELYSLVEEKPFAKENADYPESMAPYDAVLNQWKSKDKTLLDDLVSQLCEKHLEQSQEQKTDQDYFEFGDTYAKLFPYEILAWFIYRERAGLKNPTTFTHPLMNTPIAQFFLALQKPLPYPTELPYGKEFMQMLKESCPNVEIPQWLLTINNEESPSKDTTFTSPIKGDNNIPDDFFKDE